MGRWTSEAGRKVGQRGATGHFGGGGQPAREEYCGGCHGSGNVCCSFSFFPFYCQLIAVKKLFSLFSVSFLTLEQNNLYKRNKN